MINLFLKAENFLTPADPVYLLAASNGLFLVRSNPLFTSVTPATGVPGLQAQQHGVSLNFPRLPRRLLELVYGFFKEVHRLWNAEAIVFLYYSPSLKRFRVAVPAQTVPLRWNGLRWCAEGSLQYEYLHRPEEYLKIGDIHSHRRLSAFFSQVDDDDDCDDGLRLVMGRLDEPAPDLAASFVVSGTRFLLQPRDVCEDFHQPLSPPPAWLRKITRRFEGAGIHDSFQPGFSGLERCRR